MLLNNDLGASIVIVRGSWHGVCFEFCYTLTHPSTHMKTLFTLAAALLSLSLTRASAVVMTFDSLENLGSDFSPLRSYTEAGFSLGSPDAVRGAVFVSWSQANDYYAGSAGLAINYLNRCAVLTAADGGIFSLQSMDLAAALGFSAPFEVSFMGQSENGPVMAAVMITGSGFTTFNFPSSFTNLTSVSWRQASGFRGAHQFDNIVLASSVTESGNSVVPDGGTTLALLGLALTTLAGVRRKFGV